MHGLMELDAKAGRMRPVLTVAPFGILPRMQRSAYRRQWRHLFHRPGPDRPARSDRAGLSAVAGGRLDCLIDTGISPNGLVLDPTETVLFVAMTRDNAVWRVPLMKDGNVSKVGRFCSTFGTSGPDGLTMDKAGPAVRGARIARPCVRVRAQWRIDRADQILRRAKLHQCRHRRHQPRPALCDGIGDGTVIVADISDRWIDTMRSP